MFPEPGGSGWWWGTLAQTHQPTPGALRPTLTLGQAALCWGKSHRPPCRGRCSGAVAPLGLFPRWGVLSVPLLIAWSPALQLPAPPWPVCREGCGLCHRAGLGAGSARSPGAVRKRGNVSVHCLCPGQPCLAACPQRPVGERGHDNPCFVSWLILEAHRLPPPSRGRLPSPPPSQHPRLYLMPHSPAPGPALPQDLVSCTQVAPERPHHLQDGP